MATKLLPKQHPARQTRPHSLRRAERPAHPIDSFLGREAILRLQLLNPYLSTHQLHSVYWPLSSCADSQEHLHLAGDMQCARTIPMAKKTMLKEIADVLRHVVSSAMEEKVGHIEDRMATKDQVIALYTQVNSIEG